MKLPRHGLIAMLGGVAFSALLIASSGASAGGGPEPTSGCGKAAAGGELTLSTHDGAGRVRTFLVEAPDRSDPGKPHALVFVFHGAGGTGRTAASWGLQNAPGAASNAIFVFPDGIAYQHFGVGWDDTAGGYDLPFFDHMLAEIGARYCVDAARVFAAGFSWGGDFAIALACNRGDKLDAIAANSTNDEFKDTSNFMTYQNLPCPTRVHPRVRFEHAVDGDQAYPPPDFATTSNLFRYLNSCGKSREPVATSALTVSCVTYTGCASDYLECTFDHALGHRLPPNWAADTWAFFMARPGH